MKELEKMLSIIDRLRGPEGCPWDREQTLETLLPQLREELYEIMAALNRLDRENLKEELGDVLFGVLMICQVVEANQGISLDSIASGISEKMIRRHPHVFGDVQVRNKTEVVDNWDAIKAREKNSDVSTIFPDRCHHLPALSRAQKIQKRAARIGFDWEKEQEILDKIKEELAEVVDEIQQDNHQRIGEELGDLLFSVVNLARFYRFDSESLLHQMTDRWIDRFKKIEEIARDRGIDLEAASLKEMDLLWDEASGRVPGARS